MYTSRGTMLKGCGSMKQIEETTKIKMELTYEDEGNSENNVSDPSLMVKQEQDFETNDSHDYIDDLTTYVQADDSMNTKMPGSEKVEQPALYEESEDVLLEDDSITITAVVYKKADARVARGNSAELRMSEHVTDVCEILDDDMVTVPNELVSDKTSGKDAELCVANTYCMLVNNAQIYTERKFVCDICGVGFGIARHFERHKTVHTREKPYMCDVCGSCFIRCNALNRHLRTHTGEKPYKCDICGLGFTTSDSLKSHIRVHTGERPYKCTVCGLGFTQCGSLKVHKRTHTGEKPYKCEVCGLRFANNGNLKIHFRIHTGEKPYKCDVCSLGFTQCSSLKIHKRTHTGEKPYKCDVCGEGFSNNGNFKIHFKIHKG